MKIRLYTLLHYVLEHVFDAYILASVFDTQKAHRFDAYIFDYVFVPYMPIYLINKPQRIQNTTAGYVFGLQATIFTGSQ